MALTVKGKKRFLCELLFRTGTLHGLKAMLRDRIVVLNYHRIRPDDADFSTPFDEGVYGPTASQFEEQMLWLKRHVHLLTEAELIACAHAGRGPGKMSVLLTTDDGYRDNYTRAYPILSRHRIPAIFFVPSGLIESRSLGWWDRLAYVLKRTAKSQIAFEGKTLDLVGRREEALEFLKRRMIDATQGGVREPLEDLARICEVDPPTGQEQDRELMTWEQLAEIHMHDIAIGSHTHSHPVLSRLDPERQREELTVSRELITRRIGCPIRSIAYPIGGRSHFTAQTQRIGKETGYELGFSFYSGFNRWSTIDAFDIRRTTVTYHDRIGVAGAAILPELLSWAK